MMQTAVNYKIKYEEALTEIALLKHQLKEQQRFIPSGNNPSQLNLDMQVEEIAACKIIDAKKIECIRHTKEVTEKKEHPGRMKLPEHLERREIIIEPEQNAEGYKKIGEEVTEELEYEAGKLFVNRYVRPKYVSADKE